MIEFTPEINAATESVHAWLRSEILRKLAVAPVDESKPLREPEKPKAREIVPRAKSVRKVRASERKPRAPRVRKARVIPGMPPSTYRDDINLEVILECWQQGLDMNQIAAKLNCHRSAVNKRLVVARQDAEFRQAEAELTKCPKCGKPKRQYRDNCGACQKRTGRQPGSNGGHNRNAAVTIEAILDGWRNGRRTSDIATDLGCSHELLSLRIYEARKNPELAAAIARMRTCACGKPKHYHAQICKRCGRNKARREKTAARNSHNEAVLTPQIDLNLYPRLELPSTFGTNLVTG